MNDRTRKSIPAVVADAAHQATEWFAALLLLTMVVVVLYQVFARYVLNASPSWSEEVAVLCMIWFGFLGIAIGVRYKLHIAIDYFTGFLPSPWRAAMSIFAGVMVLAFAVALFVYGGRKTLQSSHRLTATGLPGMVQYVVVPLTAALVFLQTLRNLLSGDNE